MKESNGIKENGKDLLESTENPQFSPAVCKIVGSRDKTSDFIGLNFKL